MQTGTEVDFFDPYEIYEVVSWNVSNMHTRLLLDDLICLWK